MEAPAALGWRPPPAVVETPAVTAGPRPLDVGLPAIWLVTVFVVALIVFVHGSVLGYHLLSSTIDTLQGRAATWRHHVADQLRWTAILTPLVAGPMAAFAIRVGMPKRRLLAAGILAAGVAGLLAAEAVAFVEMHREGHELALVRGFVPVPGADVVSTHGYAASQPSAERVWAVPGGASCVAVDDTAEAWASAGGGSVGPAVELPGHCLVIGHRGNDQVVVNVTPPYVSVSVERTGPAGCSVCPVGLGPRPGAAQGTGPRPGAALWPGPTPPA